MSSLLITFLLAFGVLLIALAFFGIGWLITGKSRFIRGACGLDPDKVRDERCGRNISCEICKKPVKKEETETEDE